MRTTRRNSRLPGRSAVVEAVAPVLLAAAAASGIDIQVTYNAGASNPPAADPNGTRLMTIMNHVATFYEDVFKDNHTLTLNVFYEDLTGNTLGSHTLLSQSGGRETSGRIRFDTPTAWFFDASPNNNSEYNLSQTLFRNLSATQRTDLYNIGGNVPQTLEAGFTGARNSTDPATNFTTDLLTVAMHEVGHALGMSASNNTTVSQTNDGDYDFNAANVFGNALAARVAPTNNIAHLSGTQTLMQPNVGVSLRRLPSHTDLLSMASGSGFAQIDLPRKEYYGGTGWHVAGNWSGNRVPDINDDVFIRRSGPNGEARVANLSNFADCRTLVVSEGGIFATQSFPLTAFNGASVDGSGSSIRVDFGGSLNTGGSLAVSNNALLFVNGGLVSSVVINNNSNISGNGTVQVNTLLNNAGSINTFAGPLVIKNNGSFAQLDLDGPKSIGFQQEFGVVNATNINSPLTITGPMSDDFNGVMTIGRNTVTVTNPWTIGTITDGGSIALGNDGLVKFEGGSTSATAAVLAGATVTVRGGLNVATNSFARLTAPAILTPTAFVTVNTGGTLRYDGGVRIDGGNFSGGGTLFTDGNLNVTANTTTSASFYDMGGDVAGHTIAVAPGATWTINSVIVDQVDDNIEVRNGARLNLGSSLATGANVDVSGGQINGSAVAGLTVRGTLFQQNATSTVSAPLTLTNATVNSFGSGVLRTTGGLAINGAVNKQGGAEWRIGGNQAYFTPAAINVNAGIVTFDSGAAAIADNLSLNMISLGTQVNFNATQRLSVLSLSPFGRADMTAGGNTTVLKTRAVTFPTALGGVSGMLDLGDETMIVNYGLGSPIEQVRQLLVSGRNGNLWNGNGIMSDAAAADPANFALGFVEASAIGSPATFAGEPIDNTAVLVRFTLLGDANLDRTVNLTDFGLLASNFNQFSTWGRGDFNYDQVTNVSDFALLAGHMNQSIAALAPSLSDASASPVPEPAAAMMLLAGLPLLARRRR